MLPGGKNHLLLVSENTDASAIGKVDFFEPITTDLRMNLPFTFDMVSKTMGTFFSNIPRMTE